MALNCAGVPNDPDSLNDFLKENGGYNGLQVDWDITRKVSLRFSQRLSRESLVLE